MNYIVFDLEATCWEQGKGKIFEIIEVGAVKVDNNLKIIDTFSYFVRPVLNPVLSDFCKKLTSIKQEQVDKADPFEKVMDNFASWVCEKDNDIKLLSWGRYDKKQITYEAGKKAYSGPILSLLDNHISLKHRFAEIKDIRPCGMKGGLRLLGIPLEGTHHRGIDDAHNIAKIFIKVYPKWFE